MNSFAFNFYFPFTFYISLKVTSKKVFNTNENETLESLLRAHLLNDGKNCSQLFWQQFC